MAVTVSAYNHTAKLLLNAASPVSFTSLYVELLSSSASFTASHTSVSQVNNGSSATVTVTIASPGVFTDTSHGFSDTQKVQFLTTGALPTGITAGTVYYIVNSTTHTYQISATSGGSAINTTGSQSGVHTRYSIGAYEVSGNGWTAGGENIANVTAATATTNDSLIDADDTAKTASGGSIGPASAAVVYDRTTMRPLIYIDFGGAQTAGVATDFRFTWNAAGLFTGTVA